MTQPTEPLRCQHRALAQTLGRLSPRWQVRLVEALLHLVAKDRRPCGKPAAHVVIISRLSSPGQQQDLLYAVCDHHEPDAWAIPGYEKSVGMARPKRDGGQR